MRLLTQKKAIVTGGTSGIGKEIAKLFAKNGASVVIYGTNQERAKSIIKELNALKVDNSQEFLYELVDVSNLKNIENSINSILSRWSQIDILVNNAGITKDNLLMKMDEQDWDQVININLKSVYNLCKSLVRSMMKAKRGKIINISSVIGLIGNAGQVNYAAAKSGMIGFSKSLAKELASRGVCVNCIAPGYINTPMTEMLSDSIKDQIKASIPMKRIGSPTDIAQAALFLASALSDYITGQVLTVDGGMVM
jgi:3-oxoacyl-[acyl-carrier protein] reductase